jgi:hypothetical protein
MLGFFISRIMMMADATGRAKGGKARAAKMTAEERTNAASKAATARWGKEVERGIAKPTKPKTQKIKRGQIVYIDSDIRNNIRWRVEYFKKGDKFALLRELDRDKKEPKRFEGKTVPPFVLENHPMFSELYLCEIFRISLFYTPDINDLQKNDIVYFEEKAYWFVQYNLDDMVVIKGPRPYSNQIVIVPKSQISVKTEGKQ